MSGSTKWVRVWDAPTRLFHWAIVLLVGFSWFTMHEGWMDLHFLSGYTILALLLFRLIWGFVGSESARFGRFLASPAAALRHLAHIHRREPDGEAGHNAAGGWMVLLMLALLLVQTVTGLLSNDDVMTDGPLVPLVGKSWSDWFTNIHSTREGWSGKIRMTSRRRAGKPGRRLVPDKGASWPRSRRWRCFAARRRVTIRPIGWPPRRWGAGWPKPASGWCSAAGASA